MAGGFITFVGISVVIIISFYVMDENWSKIYGFKGIKNANDCKALPGCINTRPTNILYGTSKITCKTDKLVHGRCQCTVAGSIITREHC